MTDKQIAASKILFRAESHLRNQMMLLSTIDYMSERGYTRIQALIDAIRILFEAGWRI